MEIMSWMLNLAWKLLIVCAGWMLFRYILKNGRGTIKNILDCIDIIAKTIRHWIQTKCINYLKKEPAQKSDGIDMQKVYEVYCKTMEQKVLSFEDFERKMRNNEPFNL